MFPFRSLPTLRSREEHLFTLMVSPRIRTRSRLPQMEWTDSWSVAANADQLARGDKSVPQTPRDNLLSPTSRSPAPLHKYNAGAVSEWLETAALDSNFSLDDDRMLDDDVVREFSLLAFFLLLLQTRAGTLKH